MVCWRIPSMRQLAAVLLLTPVLSGLPAKGETVPLGRNLRHATTVSLPLRFATPVPSHAAETTTAQNVPGVPPPAAQLPLKILVDRQLVRAERLLANDDPGAALEVMNGILALRDRHHLVLEDDFRFKYAQVAFAAGQTQTAITWLQEYLASAGRAGEFYRKALELLDAADLKRSPPIFDTTPFRDKNRLFHNVGNDIFATGKLPQHYPFSQCA